MSVTALTGITGINPRDFLAALGLLRVLSAKCPEVRLSFTDDAGYVPKVHGIDRQRLSAIVVQDAAGQAGPQSWRLEYDKSEKRGTRRVADLKAPPAAFRAFLESAMTAWSSGDRDGTAYAAAYATDLAVDSKGNTKPTAMHFTAANQQFLDTVERIRAAIDATWCDEALFEGHADRSGPNLRWDPSADRSYALMAENPNAKGTAVNAPLEWLAFRSLPLLPVVPRGARAATTGVRGRGDDMQFRWPLWSPATSLLTTASLVRLDWWDDRVEHRQRGVIAICSAEIRRTGQGFGNFGPATVSV